MPAETGSTYALSGADLGKRLEVEISATSDLNPATRTIVVSAPSAVVAAAPVAMGQPTPAPAATPTLPPLTGGPTGPTVKPVALIVTIKRPKKLKIGSTLTAPKTLAGYRKISYQWLRNGKAIRKATKRGYRLTRSDAKKRISCMLVLTATSGAKITVVSSVVVVPKGLRGR